jgi:hypothetical protein
MKITQVAVVLIRIVSITFFVNAVVLVTEMPPLISGISKYQADKMLSEHEFSLLIMVLAKLCIYLVAGICFLIFARPLARLFTKDLDEN